MSTDLYAWGLILGLALVAFAARAILILPGGRVQLSPAVERLLRYAPASALAAIIVPDLFRIDGLVTLDMGNPRLLAGLVALVVAVRTRHILLTIVSGMAVLILARVLFG